ncbi:adenine deaminase [Bacteroidota bacterium]
MKSNIVKVSGHMVCIEEKTIKDVEILICGKRIIRISENKNVDNVFIIPGFVDSHVHIESSMLIPSEFSNLAGKFGTVGVVSDPHEIANVCGIEGIEFMIENAKNAFIKFYFGVPSCVPATIFEKSGAELSSIEVEKLIKRKDMHFLSELMNYPAVINGEKDILRKIIAAKQVNKPIDGHAPGLSGDNLEKYISAGISTDHETTTYSEGVEKIKKGMKLLIRKGSAADNFKDLYKIIDEFPESVMLCTDDIHPGDLRKGHINAIVKKGIDLGVDLYNILTAACINPVKHYGLNIGLLGENELADFVVLKDLKSFEVLETYVEGECFDANKSKIFVNNYPNIFVRKRIDIKSIEVNDRNQKIKVIEVTNGKLFTNKKIIKPKVHNGKIIADIENDILKIVLLSRYDNSKPTVGFIKNFGINNGALASSIAHDSHNIICVGSNDADILGAINSIIDNKGCISVSTDNTIDILPLPVGGIMSLENPDYVADKHLELSEKAKNIGSNLKAPFMTLSLMALLVIPELKISDKGIFDVNTFQITSLFDES